jgi:thioredoxin-like negative regulator of GroEL
MKPDWDKLGDAYKDSATVVIGDVDCTADEAKNLCSRFGVRGYPTIKTFSGNPMGDDYKGGRSYDELKEHVDKNMGPSCGPDNKDLCSASELKELEELLALGSAELEKKLKETQEELDNAGKEFEKFVEGLQSSYEKASKEKEDKENELAPKIKMLRAAASAGKGKEEL